MVSASLLCKRLAGWRAGEPSPSEAADPPRKREDAVRYWRAFHHVFKLTDVAGPLVAPEQRQRAGRETPHILAEAAREFSRKCSAKSSMSDIRLRNGGNTRVKT